MTRTYRPEPVKMLTLRLPESVADQVEQAARAENCTMNSWIKSAVLEKLARTE